MDSVLKDKVILITGGTGSFGQKLARRLILDGQCQKIIIFSRDEWKQWEMKERDPIFNSPLMRFFLGDIRDRSRLERAFDGVDIIIHAAALKQVPAAEYNPSEFIKTNIIGGMNIIEAAIDCGVKKVLTLSTDKAVNPINLYGSSKHCLEKLMVAGNAYVGKRGYPRFSVARYGNVANSRGSIVPFWRRIIEEGAKKITVTDPRMTRFWITLEQSVDFVLNALERMHGGEVFIPKIPSIRIVDLAEAMAPNMPIEVVGIRAGEKIHELLVSKEEARHTLAFDDYYAIVPELAIHRPAADESVPQPKGEPLPEDFFYSSDNNPHWLTVKELEDLLRESLC